MDSLTEYHYMITILNTYRTTIRISSIFVLFFFFESSAYPKDEVWDGKALLCVNMPNSSDQTYYGILFYKGKVKELSIREGTVYEPNDSLGSSYSLVKVLSAYKIFWRGSSGVHSLDRRNFFHLLDGKERGWCRIHPKETLEETLSSKILEQQYGTLSRSIEDELR